MKHTLLFLLVALGLRATDLQLFVHTPGTTPDGPVMASPYRFPDTALGASSSVYLRLKNTSTTQVYLMRAVFSGNATYAVDGSVLNNCLAVGGFEDITITFAPNSLGASSTPLQIAYLAYPASTGCPSSPPLNVSTVTIAALTGNAVAPTLTTTVTLDNTTAPISSGSTLSFGQVSIGEKKTATFTVTNATASTLPIPTPAIVSSVFSQSPYTLGPLTNWPSSLDPGGSASFTLGFAPTIQALVTATLTLGSRSYPLTGAGVPGPGAESLLVSYTLPTGVHYNITPPTPVDFGSVQTASTANYIFTITNPATNFASQTISSIALSGAGFAVTSLPSLPVIVKPGDTTSFTVAFAPSQAGVQSATLSIATLQFSLTGKGVTPALNPSIQLSPAILSSGQQAQVSIPLSSASQSNTTGTLTVSFMSSVSGVTDDPAVLFVTSGTRTANVNFVTGASAGSFANGQNNLTFQTGTTAGTLKFVLSFASGQTVSKSVDITPTAVQFASSSATKQSPYLVINVTGYDNTYTAGKILFNFYDTKGTLLTPGGVSVDEAQDFHNYFFVNNQLGGAFALQAKFPVTGDITTIGAADVMVQNANGQSQTQHLTF